jgi:hypothetical protein
MINEGRYLKGPFSATKLKAVRNGKKLGFIG